MGKLEKARLMITLLLMSMLTSTFNIQPIAAELDLDHIYYATANMPETVDPAWAYDTASQALIQNIYEPLCIFNVTDVYSFLPAIADWWPGCPGPIIPSPPDPSAPAGTVETWYFHIRQNVPWHDPTYGYVTPEDIEYSFERGMLQDRWLGPQWKLYEPLLGCTGSLEYDFNGDGVIDKTEYNSLARGIDGAIESNSTHVWFNLMQHYESFQQILSQTWSSVMCRRWCEEQGLWNKTLVETYGWDSYEAYNEFFRTWLPQSPGPLMSPTPRAMGTGPYKLVAMYPDPHTGYYTLEKFDNYWRGWPAPAEFFETGQPAGGYVKNATVMCIEEWPDRKARFFSTDPGFQADFADVPDLNMPEMHIGGDISGLPYPGFVLYVLPETKTNKPYYYCRTWIRGFHGTYNENPMNPGLYFYTMWKEVVEPVYYVDISANITNATMVYPQVLVYDGEMRVGGEPAWINYTISVSMGPPEPVWVYVGLYRENNATGERHFISDFLDAIPPNETITENFTWYESETMTEGDWRLGVYAIPIATWGGELVYDSDLNNNRMSHPQIIEAREALRLGDINGDGIVDIIDAIRLSCAFGSTNDSLLYDYHCDLLIDGFVDIFDAIYLACNFGYRWPPVPVPVPPPLAFPPPTRFIGLCSAIVLQGFAALYNGCSIQQNFYVAFHSKTKGWYQRWAQNVFVVKNDTQGNILIKRDWVIQTRWFNNTSGRWEWMYLVNWVDQDWVNIGPPFISLELNSTITPNFKISFHWSYSNQTGTYTLTLEKRGDDVGGRFSETWPTDIDIMYIADTTTNPSKHKVNWSSKPWSYVELVFVGSWYPLTAIFLPGTQGSVWSYKLLSNTVQIWWLYRQIKVLDFRQTATAEASRNLDWTVRPAIGVGSIGTFEFKKDSRESGLGYP